MARVSVGLGRLCRGCIGCSKVSIGSYELYGHFISLSSEMFPCFAWPLMRVLKLYRFIGFLDFRVVYLFGLRILCVFTTASGFLLRSQRIGV